MKIRWSKNSVRFRITPSELENLQQGLPVEEELFLSGGGWLARISIGNGRNLSFTAALLQIYLTPGDVAELAAPTVEGVYFTTDSEPKIRYFIEKDFPCAHPRASESAETSTETFAPRPILSAVSSKISR